MTGDAVVVGSSGFVGSAVVEALTAAGVSTSGLRAPRLRTGDRDPSSILEAARRWPLLSDLATGLAGASCVVNAAGDPDASSLDADGLTGANALVPAVLLLACERAGVRRLVHVSSAVVQNDVATLDESETMSPFSDYSLSKVLGEQVLREGAAGAAVQVVRYRPPSVHAADRRVTRMVTAVARSPFASVARPGDQPTPQALLGNVADAVSFLATCQTTPAPVVAHPSEGVTCAGLMEDLAGGRTPRRIPAALARAAVRTAKTAGRLHPPTAANARRAELLWLGQAQAESWLEGAGWRPPLGRAAWRALAAPVPGREEQA